MAGQPTSQRAVGLDSSSARRPRILFAIHAPWDETFGLSQVFIELARQFERKGWEWEKYSPSEAFPRKLGKLRGYFGISIFQRRLLRYIREHGHRFDAIHVDHMLVPFARAKYRYSGCLVVKAQGLIHFFEKYFRMSLDGKASLAGRSLRKLGWIARGGVKSAERGFAAADQIHLLNSDEFAFVRDQLGHGDKVVLIPNGLSEQRRGAFAGSCAAARRADSNAVVFVGVWSLRKGSAEFPAIVRAVRRRRPDTRFRLIGAHFEAEVIRAELAPEDRDAVEIIPRFPREDLPALLADARVGVFPSHVEGFPLGLLEMLAAGIPVVAWDAPGARDMIRPIPELKMTPAGDIEPTATELIRWLDCGREDYVRVAEACRQSTEKLTWDQIGDSIEREVARGIATKRGR